ncbi:MAG: hypothetical protein Q8O95_05430 [bacterium]|nr:hypothetical protein [bacterium]
MGIASLVVMVSTFLPWYGINSRVINEWWNAFGSIGSVAGYVVFVSSAIVFTLIVTPVIKPEFNIGKRLPWNEGKTLFFLSAQSCFVTVLFMPVYAQYSLINATNSGTRFGLYMTLIGTLTSSVFALIYQRRMKDAELRQADFATVPRSQRSVNYWQNGNEDNMENMNEEKDESTLEQESIFHQGTGDQVSVEESDKMLDERRENHLFQ